MTARLAHLLKYNTAIDEVILEYDVNNNKLREVGLVEISGIQRITLVMVFLHLQVYQLWPEESLSGKWYGMQLEALQRLIMLHIVNPSKLSASTIKF